MNNELASKLMIELVALNSKTYSSLTKDKVEDDKVKGPKKCAIKEKQYPEATQLENKINQLEKNKVDADSLKENHEEFIKINRSILKSQQRFRTEKHNVFTEEVNKIAWSTNNDKRIQSID